MNEEIAYDKAGNITSLKRGPSSNTATAYSYTNGNQLSGVAGPVAGSFTYDVNGNAITDGTRKVTGINYNLLNLPSSVTVYDPITTITKTASYVYDATGTKLRSVQGSIVRDYVSGIQYNTSGTIDFIATEEGRAVRNSNGTYRYEYNLKDNLGNVRVTIDNNGGSGRRVVQEDEYYAFGLSVNKLTSGDKNNYLYNGKELQDVLSNEYDYGARFYDPVIARWQVVDPLAELTRRYSPYNYVVNNPIRFIDPDGMQVGNPTITSSIFDGVVNAVKTTLIAVEFTAVGVGTAVVGTALLVLAPQNGTGAGSAKGPGWNKPLLPPPAIPNVKRDKTEDKSESKTTERGTEGKLEKSPTGKGTTPPSERAKQRVPSAKEKAKEREDNDYNCANCGNETKAEDTRSHHYPKRHADGGKKTVPVCKDCHTYLHGKN